MEKKLTAQQLIDFCYAMLGQNYWYACWSQVADEKLYKEKLAQNPDKIGKWPKETYVAQYGTRVMDCSGLLKAAGGSHGNPKKIPSYSDIRDIDWSANQMIEKCSDVVDFKNIPEIAGQLVWKPGHVGVFIKTLADGKKLVIESAGHMKGVIESTDTAWQKAGKLPFVDYNYLPTPTPTPKTGFCFVELPVLKKGDKNYSVKVVQMVLNGLGYKDQNGNKLDVDGSFGGKTDFCVRAFQKNKSLTVDGIVGGNTWAVLLT